MSLKKGGLGQNFRILLCSEKCNMVFAVGVLLGRPQCHIVDAGDRSRSYQVEYGDFIGAADWDITSL